MKEIARGDISLPYGNEREKTLPWASVTYLVAGQRELCEILFEACSKISRLAIIAFFICPCIPRNEQLTGHTRTRRGRMQAKDWVCNYLNIVEHPTDSCSHHRSRMIDVDALADTIWATSPTGIDKIAAHLIFFNTLTQQISIFSWSQGQKGGSKTRTESCLRCRHTSFCSC